MVPSYIDMFYPQIGAAAVELLEKLGVEVDYPFNQTCRGQHLRNKFAAVGDTPERRHVSSHVGDLPEFLCDVPQAEESPWAEFPHQVAQHGSCSAIRGPQLCVTFEASRSTVTCGRFLL